MANIFISYNRKAEAVAKNLADDLEVLNNTVWFDKDLSGGQVWWDRILKTIRDCDIFVFLLDPESLNSTACKREYGYAADLGKPILPVLVAEGVSINLLPPLLSQIQFVDYRKQDRNAAFRLARAVTTVPLPEPLPEPLPPPPEAPISYLASLAEKIETGSTLNYEKQSTLLVDLKRSLREPESADDAYVLLERLRKRRDLLATIAEEIDELLASRREVSTPPGHSPEPEPPAQEPAQPPQPDGKTEAFESKGQVPQKERSIQQEKTTQKHYVSSSDLPRLSGKSGRERHESRKTSADTDTLLHPLSHKKYGPFVKPAFAILGPLSLFFLVFSVVNANHRDSNVGYIQFTSLLYYGLATIFCLFGYMNFPVPIRAIRRALLLGVILGIGMSFWAVLMEGHRITFDEISLAWVAAALGYGGLSGIVFFKL